MGRDGKEHSAIIVRNKISTPTIRNFRIVQNKMEKQLQIRNSTAEFLIFQAEDQAQGVQVFYQEENIWATQEAIATLFDKGRSTIAEHLRNIFASGELNPDVVCRKFRQTTQHGAIAWKTQTKEVAFYKLDAIISVGYRVNSVRATQKQVAEQIGKSERTVKSITVRLQQRGLLRRANGKRDGHWEIVEK